MNGKQGPSHMETLYYRNVPHMDSLVFAPPEEAEYISKIHRALSSDPWGEFRSKMPEHEFQELVHRLAQDDESDEIFVVPGDNDPFDAGEWFPEWADGDYPDWLQQRQAEWLPDELLGLGISRFRY